MITPELPPLPPVPKHKGSMDKKTGAYFIAMFDAFAERERILLARVAELHKDLADCFRLTGADPDSNEDWRLARWAVKEVAAMRTDLDLVEARVAELERLWQSAEACYAEADAAAMSHAKRIAELEAALDAVIIRTDSTSLGMGYDIWKIANAARGAK